MTTDQLTPISNDTHSTSPSPVSVRDGLEGLMSERSAHLRYLQRRVGAADAEDLLQQALARAAEKWGTLRDPARALPWFYALMRRVVADHYARLHRWSRSDDAASSLSDDADACAPAPDDGPRVCGCSLGLLDGLKAEYAVLLRCVDLNEMSLAEVAQQLGITANNAAVRLHRARRALRDALAKTCGTTSARACVDCCCA